MRGIRANMVCAKIDAYKVIVFLSSGVYLRIGTPNYEKAKSVLSLLFNSPLEQIKMEFNMCFEFINK